jgi:hypothetical protein
MASYNQVPKLVSEEARHCYGMPSVEIVATNNAGPTCLFDYANSPSTYRVQKEIFPVHCSLEFGGVYNSTIEPAIMQILSTIPEWAIRPLRLGFSEDQMANPMVIQIVVPRNYLADDEAFAILKEIVTKVSEAWPETEKSEK